MQTTISESLGPKYWSRLLDSLATTQSEATFAELHAHFSPLIRSFLQGQGGGMAVDVAEEIAQEVMMKVWFKAGTYDSSKAAASTWIFTLTRNARIDHIRKHARRNELTDPLTTEDIWDEDETNNPFAYLHQNRTEKHVREMMNTLPVEQQKCIQKMYMEGKSHSEISKDLNLPLGTVKSRVRLALKRLKAHLDLH